MPRNAQTYRADPGIIHDALAQLSWMPGYEKVAANEKGLRLFEKCVRNFADDREMDHAILGKVIPLDWLLEQIGETVQFFPKPIEMRRMYTKYFSPLDGFEARELEERVEA